MKLLSEISRYNIQSLEAQARMMPLHPANSKEQLLTSMRRRGGIASSLSSDFRWASSSLDKYSAAAIFLFGPTIFRFSSLLFMAEPRIPIARYSAPVSPRVRVRVSDDKMMTMIRLG